MKKLTIEEKAQRYDEAIERAKEWSETKNGYYTPKELCEEIFPELKESEGEKIRKELISFVRGMLACHDKPNAERDEKYESWIAWLEKQGEHINFLSKIQVGDKVTRNKDGVLVNLSQLNRVAKPAEKQCKKLAEKYNITGIKSKHAEGKLGEMIKKIKPADKVEPKFREGEWITNGDYTWKIIEVKSLDYILQSQDGNIVDDTISHVDEQFHSFTIEDARDGDILVCPKYAGDIIPNIFIFKDIKIKDNDVFCYCSFLEKFRTESYVANADPINTDFYPATKEQRDTLMKAMTDAGYTFDFEKKELKKIEQKSADKFEPKFKAGDKVLVDGKIYTIKLVNEDNYIVDENGRDVQEHFSYTKDWKLYEQNPAWSEEDEMMIKFTLTHFRKTGATEDSDIIKWLKSLKERIQPQPKQEWKQENTDDLTDFENAMMHIGGSFFGQHAGLDPNDTNAIKEQANLLLELVPNKEWSEEERQIIKDAACFILSCVNTAETKQEEERLEELADKLQDIRPQNRWKPTEKQMETLEYYMHTLLATEHKEILFGLYNDLKQL